MAELPKVVPKGNVLPITGRPLSLPSARGAESRARLSPLNAITGVIDSLTNAFSPIGESANQYLDRKAAEEGKQAGLSAPYGTSPLPSGSISNNAFNQSLFLSTQAETETRLTNTLNEMMVEYLKLPKPQQDPEEFLAKAKVYTGTVMESLPASLRDSLMPRLARLTVKNVNLLRERRLNDDLENHKNNLTVRLKDSQNEALDAISSDEGFDEITDKFLETVQQMTQFGHLNEDQARTIRHNYYAQVGSAISVRRNPINGILTLEENSLNIEKARKEIVNANTGVPFIDDQTQSVRDIVASKFVTKAYDSLRLNQADRAKKASESASLMAEYQIKMQDIFNHPELSHAEKVAQGNLLLQDIIDKNHGFILSKELLLTGNSTRLSTQQKQRITGLLGQKIFSQVQKGETISRAQVAENIKVKANQCSLLGSFEEQQACYNNLQNAVQGLVGGAEGQDLVNLTRATVSLQKQVTKHSEGFRELGRIDNDLTNNLNAPFPDPAKIYALNKKKMAVQKRLGGIPKPSPYDPYAYDDPGNVTPIYNYARQYKHLPYETIAFLSNASASENPSSLRAGLKIFDSLPDSLGGHHKQAQASFKAADAPDGAWLFWKNLSRKVSPLSSDQEIGEAAGKIRHQLDNTNQESVDKLMNPEAKRKASEDVTITVENFITSNQNNWGLYDFVWGMPHPEWKQQFFYLSNVPNRDWNSPGLLGVSNVVMHPNVAALIDEQTYLSATNQTLSLTDGNDFDPDDAGVEVLRILKNHNGGFVPFTDGQNLLMFNAPGVVGQKHANVFNKYLREIDSNVLVGDFPQSMSYSGILSQAAAYFGNRSGKSILDSPLNADIYKLKEGIVGEGVRIAMGRNYIHPDERYLNVNGYWDEGIFSIGEAKPDKYGQLAYSAWMTDPSGSRQQITNKDGSPKLFYPYLMYKDQADGQIKANLPWLYNKAVNKSIVDALELAKSEANVKSIGPRDAKTFLENLSKFASADIFDEKDGLFTIKDKLAPEAEAIWANLKVSLLSSSIVQDLFKDQMMGLYHERMEFGEPINSDNRTDFLKRLSKQLTPIGIGGGLLSPVGGVGSMAMVGLKIYNNIFDMDAKGMEPIIDSLQNKVQQGQLHRVLGYLFLDIMGKQGAVQDSLIETLEKQYLKANPHLNISGT